MKRTTGFNLLAAITVIIPVVIAIIPFHHQTERIYPNFHYFFVLISSLVSLFIGIMAYIEFLKSKEKSIFFICLGFIGISILYGFHGLVTPDKFLFLFPSEKVHKNAFIFFGDLNRTWFAIMLFIPRLIKSDKITKFYSKRTILIACVLLICGSLFLLYNPLLIPDIKITENYYTHYTYYGLLSKFITLSLLGVCCINYFESYKILRKVQTLTLFLSVFLMMDTVVIFFAAEPWTYKWWLSHILYLLSFLIIGIGVFISIKNNKYQYFNVWNEVDKYIENIVIKKENLERKVNNLEFLAKHDYLTGLYNRVYFIQFLEHYIVKAKEDNESFGLLFIDLDGFKAVNDAYGHGVGDILLSTVSKILVDNVREVDFVSRFGGDEFIIFLHNTKKQDVIDISERILTSFKAPIMVNERNCSIGASIGISMFPDDGDSIETLISKSDERMYMVKKSGKNGYSFASDKDNT